MKILIPTVPHTGTHLLSSFFEKAGFASVPVHMQNKPENSVTTTHIDTPTRMKAVTKSMKEFTTVVPIRHPYLVAESWMRREQRLERMYAAYRRLPYLYEMGALFVPVDSPERDSFIERMNDKLGTNIRPDWGEVINGYQNTHNMTYKDIEPLPEVKALAEDLNTFLANFYGELTVEKTVKKKRAPKKSKDDEMIEVIALRRMLNDETNEMCEIGDTVMKMRKDARIMQDAGSIKVPL